MENVTETVLSKEEFQNLKNEIKEVKKMKEDVFALESLETKEFRLFQIENFESSRYRLNWLNENVVGYDNYYSDESKDFYLNKYKTIDFELNKQLIKEYNDSEFLASDNNKSLQVFESKKYYFVKDWLNYTYPHWFALSKSLYEYRAFTGYSSFCSYPSFINE